MSESLGRAVLELVADLNPLKRDLEAAKGESEAMASSTARSFRGGIQKAALPAAAAVGVLAIGLHKAVDAAMENQVSEAKLAAAFKASGQNIEEYKSRIDAAETSSASFGFKSEDVKASLAQLVVATHSGSQAIQMMGVAQDVARYKGISLTDASKMLTMTLAGSSRAARALGIVLPPVTTATDALKSKTQYASLAAYEHAKSTAYMSDKQATAGKMVDLLSQKLGGQAQAFSHTAEGAKEKMGAEFQLLEINIGNVLLPILTQVSTVLASFSQVMTEHATVVKIAIALIGSLAMAVLLVNAYLKTSAAVMKLVTAAQWLWNAAMDANPIMLVIIGLVALGAALYIAWNKSKTFREVVLGVWDGIKNATAGFINFFTSSVPHAVETVKNALTNGLRSAEQWVRSHWPEIATLISGPFAPIVALATNAFGIRSRLLNAFGDIVSGARSLAHGVASAFSSLGSTIVSAIKAPINGLIALLDAFHVTIGKVSILGHTVFGGMDWHPFHIPMLAEGGIVTRPTLAMIGEAGPEAVVPLSHGGHELGGGGGNITVNVSGVVGNERDVAVKIGRELEKLKSRGLTLAL